MVALSILAFKYRKVKGVWNSYVNYNKRISVQEKNNIIEIASEIIKQRKQG